VLGRMLRWVLLSLLGFGMSLSMAVHSKAQTGGTHRVTFQTDIAYHDGPEFNRGRHVLDVYRPVDVSNAPVLIFIHGGAWSTGDKQFFDYIGGVFAKQGYVTVVPNYRLSPAVQHPAHIRDVARAYAWTVANISNYGGDPSSIVLSGHSAGGHLAALLALNERYLAEQDLDGSGIQGVIGISGVYDVTSLPPFIVPNAVFTSDPDAQRDASPLFHVNEGEPPFLLLYAQFDYPTLGTQAERLHDRLINQNVESHIREIRNRIHETIVFQIGNAGDPTTAEMLGFLETRTHRPQSIGGEAE